MKVKELFTKRDLTRGRHEREDIHYIGESLPAPSQISAGGSLGSSPIPAREDHDHGSAYEFIIDGSIAATDLESESLDFHGTTRTSPFSGTHNFEGSNLDIEYGSSISIKSLQNITVDTGAAATNNTNFLSSITVGGKVLQVRGFAVSSGTQTLGGQTQDFFHYSQTANCTYSFGTWRSFASAAQKLIVLITGTGVASFSGILWSGGSAPAGTLPLLVEFITFDTGTTVYGHLIGEAYA